MRMLLRLIFRGAPLLGFLMLIVFTFDMAGAQQPMTEANIAMSTWVGEQLGNRLTNSLVELPTPSQSQARCPPPSGVSHD